MGQPIPELTMQVAPAEDLQVQKALPPFVLDIGGEGRHPSAWNLNPRQFRTLGPMRGEPIPRLIFGRSDAVPLPDDVVDLVIIERSPLSCRAIDEIKRISRPGAKVVLRHARPFGRDPHQYAKTLLGETWTERECQIGSNRYQETIFQLVLASA